MTFAMFCGFLFLTAWACSVPYAIIKLIEWDERRREDPNYKPTELSDAIQRLKIKWTNLKNKMRGKHEEK